MAGFVAATQLSVVKSICKFILEKFGSYRCSDVCSLIIYNYFGPSLSFKSPCFCYREIKLRNVCAAVAS